MAKERLSKLQKWILTETYRQGRREIGLDRAYYEGMKREDNFIRCYCQNRIDVYIGFFGSPNVTNKTRVIVSNSLRRLSEKELISLKPWLDCKAKSIIILTEKGVKRAKELIP